MGALVSDHVAELAGGNQLDRLGAEDGAQCAVEVRRAAAALQVAKDASAGLLAGAFFEFRGNNGGDAAKPSFAVGHLRGRGDEFAPLLPRAFRRDDQRKMLVFLLSRRILAQMLS